eukprot:gnl/TRDRNA2_/TRDRNA2_129499_c0_seq2.p1 gnl/TRDRNA2_/TRDRNA2_129499_c0~~gnl/TRDRNA2_/TRDRNA2_129499_c0_seq2.p1  ORF type:complete len:620 (+),score=96.53 gnl/TRDRNA2_/TRDRNA2_129499_c0_seq2:42-1901(+)
MFHVPAPSPTADPHTENGPPQEGGPEVQNTSTGGAPAWERERRQLQKADSPVLVRSWGEIEAATAQDVEESEGSRHDRTCDDAASHHGHLGSDGGHDHAGVDLSPIEKEMRATIVCLLSLPAEERRRMEVAENHSFTLAKPAPRLGDQPRKVQRTLCASFLQLDSLEVTELLCRKGFKPALLSCANRHRCGGRFDQEAGSQEEMVFRNTSLFLSLWPHRGQGDQSGASERGKWIGDFDEDLPRQDAFYPQTVCGGIYSPHVRLVRHILLPGRPLHEEYTSRPGIFDMADCAKLPLFAVLSIAAQDAAGEPPFQPALLREKARTALHLAAAAHHDAVVLGAFGCGDLRNPPEPVAAVFSELVSPGGEFATAFRAVVVAIPRGQHGDDVISAFTARFPAVEQRDLEAKLAELQLEHAAEDDDEYAAHLKKLADIDAKTLQEQSEQHSAASRERPNVPPLPLPLPPRKRSVAPPKLEPLRELVDPMVTVSLPSHSKCCSSLFAVSVPAPDASSAPVSPSPLPHAAALPAPVGPGGASQPADRQNDELVDPIVTALMPKRSECCSALTTTAAPSEATAASTDAFLLRDLDDADPVIKATLPKQPKCCSADWPGWSFGTWWRRG